MFKDFILQLCRKGFFLTPSSYSCILTVAKFRHEYKEGVKKNPFLLILLIIFVQINVPAKAEISDTKINQSKTVDLLHPDILGNNNLKTNTEVPEIEPNAKIDILEENRPTYNIGDTIKALAYEKSTKQTILKQAWSENTTIAVNLRKNIGTLISIPQNTKIVGFILGDQEGFTPKLMGEKMPNKIVISPTQYDIDTNLTLIDDSGRQYSFYLKSTTKESEIVPHFNVIVTGDEVIGNSLINNLNDNKESNNIRDEAKAEDLKFTNKELINKLTKKEYDFLEVLEASENVNSDYKIYGDKSIAPNAVWDDGRVVYFSFRNGTASSRLPVLYRVIDGYATIANSHYRDGFLISSNIADEGWMLLDGNKTICIKPSKAKKIASKMPQLQSNQLNLAR